MTSNNQKLVLYHGNCIDGFCAAWQIWRVYLNAEFRAVQYGEPAPLEAIDGRDVLIVDFCYPAPVMREIRERASGLRVLDHHATAEADMRQLQQEWVGKAATDVVFDMNRSGAGLARDLVVAPEIPELARCWIVDYVQDRDLWRFELPDSKLVNAYLHTLDFTFETFESADNALTSAEAAEIGRGAEAYKDMYVARMVDHARAVSFEGYEVPIVNAPYVAISELANALAKHAPFAIGWFQRGDGKVAFSLRSIGALDVSELAKRHGGGGHKNAAGFTLPLADALKVIGGAP